MVREIEKLDIAAIVDTKFQPLRHIVDHGGDDGIRPVEFKLRQHLEQGRPLLELLCGLVVDAIDLKHSDLRDGNKTYSVTWFCILLTPSMARR